jgi:glycerophosphoryl diester phosphodiesterase
MPPETRAQPLIVAHRGGAGHGPENTLAAFEQAWTLGADAIEGDFRLSRDGHIVCIHDADTQRVTGTRHVVAETDLEQLRALEVGSWFGAAWRGARIPTLDEVLATITPGRSLFVEVKCGPELIPPLLEAIGCVGLAAEQIVVISFHAEVIRALKQQARGYKACWLASCRRDARGRFQPDSDRVLHTLEQCGADGFGAHGRLDDAAFIHAIQQAGYEFHAWTVNDPERACWFRDLGVRSLTTDYPDRLRAALVGW